MGFVAICLFLTVPECTKCFRSADHRTLHSTNARTAFYTMAGGIVHTALSRVSGSRGTETLWSLHSAQRKSCVSLVLCVTEKRLRKDKESTPLRVALLYP